MNLKKKLLGVLLLVSGACFGVHAQNMVQVNGKITGKKSASVKLFTVVNGGMNEIANAVPSTDGSFGFNFKPDYKGYYVIGRGEGKMGMKDKYVFYFKGNEKLNLEVNDTSYVLTGENSKENKLLTEWHTTLYPLQYNALNFNKTYKEVFPLMTAIAEQSKNWMKGRSSGNKEFDALLSKTINYDVAFYALQFLNTPRSAHPAKADYTDYLKNLQPAHFLSTTDLLTFPYGARALSMLAYYRIRLDENKSVDMAMNEIPNEQLKGEFALENAGNARSYTNYQETVDKYGKYFVTTEQKQRSQAIGANLNTFKTADKAINFTYPDLNDKQVSLTDFKGKVVLVDVWATWCGPCKKEIPALKQLEEELRAQDVVFMSVSVDEEKDKEKWKKFVADQGLKGVQLFASGWSDIAKNYKITGIPRFMLFDKKGNIINVDAPRPSDPKLKETILEWLKKS
ncbi:TlpA family protein disulfide reductase [Solitalea sp. MAHUQ-68]|uniref:TlpA family protein disulfide reductase n=1 Tax=Solitalea agri TaxID=2953739 RepID=A0A9X2FAY7_9SPHI|nr:TlpA disulfide reductase family protein [Solitalea agri]MCO4293578.1 TlpA family protein disulfide reductase [Solitalea agri]